MKFYFQKEEIVELTKELIRFPTINPPGNTTKCAKFILDRFKENQIDAEIIEGKKGACNVLAKLPGRKNGKNLLLNGHIDVVPPGMGWTVDPFGGEICDGKIYGRGSSDMKSGIASMMAAMIHVKRSGVILDGNIIFMAVADEETGSKYGTVYLLNNDIGKDSDFAIVPEPTNLRIELGNRGLRWIDLKVRGKACHAGRPWLGINALSYGAKIIEAINSIKFKIRNDVFEIPEPNISVTIMTGGTKENIIPDHCDLTVDRRMIPGETTETIMKELQEIVNPIMDKEKGIKIEIKMRPDYWDPYLIKEDEPIVQATINAIWQVTGKKPEICAKGSSTDASHVYHLGGIPAILFGPGDPHLSHTVDEYVTIKNLTFSTETLILIFSKLLK